MAALSPTTNNFKILSLDGGGAKGFYTLGVLNEIEAMIGRRPLCECFDLIFGTSTGAIIAALLGLGYPVGDIHKLYKEHVPAVMRCRTRNGKSKALARLARGVFGDKKFTDVKTGVGIVATRWMLEKPMIFKGSVAQAHGRHATFEPGFGCTIADAVRASCSAYPYFDRAVITTGDGNEVELIDGGYTSQDHGSSDLADALYWILYDNGQTLLSKDRDWKQTSTDVHFTTRDIGDRTPGSSFRMIFVDMANGANYRISLFRSADGKSSVSVMKLAPLLKTK